jgi:hypothetical protein
VIQSICVRWLQTLADPITEGLTRSEYVLFDDRGYRFQGDQDSSHAVCSPVDPSSACSRA